MNDYMIKDGNGLLWLFGPNGKPIAAFATGYPRDMADKIAFCLNLGCDVMTHLQECTDGGPTLDDVVFARVDKGMEATR